MGKNRKKNERIVDELEVKIMELSIIIVSYNTKDFLQNCLTSIFETIGDIKYEVIVVDNHSSDGSIEMIKENFPKVICIENKENFGFSRANNIGVKIAKGEYILFLNSDTLIYKNTTETMLRFMQQRKDAGASTCILKMANGEMDDACHRGFPTPWNAFCYFSGLSKFFPKNKLLGGYNLSYLNIEKTHEVDALAGAFMLVRYEAGEDVGWWDEDYFFYGEDLDFCYELKEKKWKIYFVPEVSILHYKGVSGGIKKISEKITTADIETKRKVTAERFRAMRIFYEKHYTDKYPKIITWLVLSVIDFKRKNSLRKI